MKNKRRLSPFYQVKEYVENQIFNLALELQLRIQEGRSIADSYNIGYRAALSDVLAEICHIERSSDSGYNQSRLVVASFFMDDEDFVSAIELYKKRG